MEHRTRVRADPPDGTQMPRSPRRTARRPRAARRAAKQTCSRRDSARIRGVRILAALLIALAVPAKPPIVQKPIPFGAAAPRRDGRLRERHYGLDTWRLHAPARDRRALHGEHDASPRPGTRSRATRRTPSSRAAGHVRALRHRPRRDDLPARPAHDDVPAHGRAQLDGDRDRARRHERRADPRQPAPARGVARG